MKTTDWPFDFSILPYRQRRASIPYVYDHFVEIPQSDALCCIYSIVEESMGNYLGLLAILKHKASPTLYLNHVEHTGFRDNVFVNTKGTLIFLQACLYNPQKKRQKRPILIIDLADDSFSYLDTDNLNPSYRIVELDEHTFGIEGAPSQLAASEEFRQFCSTVIRPDKLRHYRLSKISKLYKLLFGRPYPRFLL